MEISATNEFVSWAMGFAGCDGGNLAGNVWCCGIEYGGDPDEHDLEFSDVSTPSVVTDAQLTAILRYQYNIKLAKFLCTLLGKEIAAYSEVAHEEGFFSGHSDFFRMNLYPISFASSSDESWPWWLYHLTGLPTKSIYRAWCQQHRFRWVRALVRKHSPRLIIGTGKSFDTDFVLAFDNIEGLYDPWCSEILGERELKWKRINDDRTILAITPFLGGRYGLSSDVLIARFGSRLAQICEDSFGDRWLRDG